MPDQKEDYEQCGGRSGVHRSNGSCQALPKYELIRPAGRDEKGTPRTKHDYACGRHLSWLIDYVTVPGASVEVVRM